jgi:hypothetical protein
MTRGKGDYATPATSGDKSPSPRAPPTLPRPPSARGEGGGLPSDLLALELVPSVQRVRGGNRRRRGDGGTVVRFHQTQRHGRALVPAIQSNEPRLPSGKLDWMAATSAAMTNHVEMRPATNVTPCRRRATDAAAGGTGPMHLSSCSTFPHHDDGQRGITLSFSFLPWSSCAAA